MADSRNYANIEFNNVECSQKVISWEHWKLEERSVERILDIGRIAMSAEMLGNAEAAFETTIEYLEAKKTIWCSDRNIPSAST